MLHERISDDLPDQRPSGGDLVLLLRRAAEALKARGLALYEAGHTLPRGGGRPTEGEDWTGLIYFAAAWAHDSGVSAPDELIGFPVAVDVSGCPALCALIDGDRDRCIVRTDSVPALFQASAPHAIGTTDVVAVRISFNESFPSIAFFCFPDRSQAEAALEILAPGTRESGLTPLPDAHSYQVPDINHDLPRLYSRLRRAAADRRLAFLADQQRAFSDIWRLPSVEEQVIEFNKVCGEQIKKLAAELDCPDVRVYLIGSSRAIEQSTSHGEEPPGTLRPRFNRQWASSVDTPDAAVSEEDAGPLGYVLKKGERFAVHNQAFAERYSDKVRRRYPGLKSLTSLGWAEGANSVQLLPAVRGRSADASLDGALLIHPIQVGHRIIGAICCIGRDKPPFVFYDWDEQSLGLFALALGSSWLNLHSRLWAERDRLLLIRAADAIDRFSHDIGQRLSNSKLTRIEIYQAALKTADVISGLKLPFSSFKLYDAGSRQFYFHEDLKNGQVWSLVNDRCGKRYDVASQGRPRSATEFAFQTGRPVTIDVLRPPEYFDNIFEGFFKHSVIVPIFYAGDKENVVAVLDVRGNETEAFPPSIRHVLRELGQMLGLLLALADYQAKVFEANASLDLRTRQQIEAFEDLGHQILSPHRNLSRQIDIMLRLANSWSASRTDERFKGPLTIARGHARRAYRVGRSIDLFAQLSTTGRIPDPETERKAITERELDARLRRLIGDHRSIIHRSEQLDIVLDPEMKSDIYRGDIVGDLGLFEQALSNLLDNAHKYPWMELS